MFRVKSYIILLSFLFLLSGCVIHSDVKNKITTTINNQGNSNEFKTIPFKYFYRGFATIKESMLDKYPNGTFIIQTDEDWHDFMDKYVPGIPYYISVDYSKECLVFDSVFPARPTYSYAIDLKPLK